MITALRRDCLGVLDGADEFWDLQATFSSFAVMNSGQEFAVKQALIPFVNVAALYKAALAGNLELAPALTTYAVMGGLAALCIVLASRIAAKDGIVFDPDLSVKKLLREGLRS